MSLSRLRTIHMFQTSLIILSSLIEEGYAGPLIPRDGTKDDKKDDSFFLSLISTILITIFAAAILVLFYRYAVKYIPSDTIRIPLKVFSRAGPDGMIRLPTSEEEAARIGETFLEEEDDGINSPPENERRFRDEDDDIPPPVNTSRKVKMTENEEDFFDVSDGEDEEENEGAQSSSEHDEGNKAWRD